LFGAPIDELFGAPNNAGVDVDAFIEGLGGTNAVAELAKVRPPSVSGWRVSKRIPDDKLMRLAPIAEQRGIATRRELFPLDYAEIWPELAESEAEQ
jgi:hypothetical protein